MKKDQFINACHVVYPYNIRYSQPAINNEAHSTHAVTYSTLTLNFHNFQTYKYCMGLESFQKNYDRIVKTDVITQTLEMKGGEARKTYVQQSAQLRFNNYKPPKHY